MKKKLALLLSSVMLLGSAYGFVGCGGEDPTQTPGGGDTPGGGVSALTEEEVFTGVQSAIADFISYDGSMTAKADMVMVMESAVEGYKQKMGSQTRISYDTVGKKAFMTSVDTEETYMLSAGEYVPVSTRKEDEKEKYYKEGDLFYYYGARQDTENDVAKDSTIKFIKDNGEVFEEFKEDQTLSGISQEEAETVFGSVGVATSFAELKTAYETVYTQQLTAQKAIDETATATAVVSATETDGAMVVSVETTAKSTYPGVGVVAKSASTIIEAKDGALSKISASQTDTILVDMEGELTPMMEVKVSTVMEYSKTFDAESFEAIVVDSSLTPEDKTEITTVLHEVQYYTFNENRIGFSGAPTDTLAEVISDFLDSKNPEVYTYSWYLDENFTTPADFTRIKLGDSKMTTVYAKISVNEGYALLHTSGETRDGRSRNYKIAFSNNLGMMMGGSESRDETYSREVSETTANVEILNGNGREIWVNGVKVSDDTYVLTYESGKYYDIEYVDVSTDAEYSIFSSSFIGE